MPARVRISRGAVNRVRGAKRVRLRQLGGDRLVVVLPFAPVEVSYENVGYEYVMVDRPGLKPLLEATTKKLRRINFTTIVADRPTWGGVSIEGLIDTISTMASADEDIRFVYGVRPLPFRVRITDFSYSSIHRNLDGQITQAEISIVLEERLNVRQGIVALDAIEYEPPSSPQNHQGGSDTTETEEDGLIPPPVHYRCILGSECPTANTEVLLAGGGAGLPNLIT